GVIRFAGRLAGSIVVIVSMVGQSAELKKKGPSLAFNSALSLYGHVSHSVHEPDRLSWQELHLNASL
ncbi:MAG: hypothetical protein ACREYC_23300, partial [Gammaproteobacteria bacterium]